MTGSRKNYDLIAFGGESTLITKYEPDPRNQTSSQSEAQLENELLRQLTTQAYERIHVTNENDLIQNLHTQPSYQLDTTHDLRNLNVPGRRHLASDVNKPGGHERFNSDAHARILRKKRIENRI